ncbi:C2 domain-containing protein [Zychaea mexicana]|uniref:C2 domain-containing protein n=1 Tax=Zychaea mexicana TaxID=64656 RepID=UPI0022FEB624|nr:C2 domain-containing protein [Zychaea mexicana]KAI9495871.1 C2 domain-containing protein [Zychaea mexicana]
MSYHQQTSYSSEQSSFTSEEVRYTTQQTSSNQQPTYQVQQSYQYQQQQSFNSLSVTFIGANLDKDVEKLGKQDPYVQFTYDFSDSKSYQQTFTHKDAGKTPQWNQTFNLPYSGAPDLFIEVMDQESTGADELIGFAAIPIRQIRPGQPLSSSFQVYDIKSNSIGVVQITFTTQPGQQGYQPQGMGQSYVHEGHLKRCKSLRNKGVATDVAGVAIGGALAIGAGLLGKKLYDDRKEEKEQREEEEQRQKEEQERMEREKQRLEQEKKQLEQQKRHQEEEQKKRHEHEKKQQHHGGGSSHHESDGGHGHGHCHQKQQSDCADSWNPVGTYAPGDKVEYHGRTYMCLQGHTSNPTWMPGAAHSLWQPC